MTTRSPAASPEATPSRPEAETLVLTSRRLNSFFPSETKTTEPSGSSRTAEEGTVKESVAGREISNVASVCGRSRFEGSIAAIRAVKSRVSRLAERERATIVPANVSPGSDSVRITTLAPTVTYGRSASGTFARPQLPFEDGNESAGWDSQRLA